MTTAGGIEEDFIKCLAPTYVDEFIYKGSEARKQGLNRIGNLIAPNDGYCMFEDWFSPILLKMLDDQQNKVLSMKHCCTSPPSNGSPSQDSFNPQ